MVRSSVLSVAKEKADSWHAFSIEVHNLQSFLTNQGGTISEKHGEGIGLSQAICESQGGIIVENMCGELQLLYTIFQNQGGIIVYKCDGD